MIDVKKIPLSVRTAGELLQFPSPEVSANEADELDHVMKDLADRISATLHFMKDGLTKDQQKEILVLLEEGLVDFAALTLQIEEIAEKSIEDEAKMERGEILDIE